MGILARASGTPFMTLTNSKFEGEGGSISMGSEELWRLVRPGDIIGISDRITHHVMIVFSVRRSERKILLVDGWPEDVFLLPDRNAAGVKAELIISGIREPKSIRKV